MAANMTNSDTGFFLKTSHRFHTNAMTAYKKAWAAVWKDIEPYKLTIAIISIISTLTALLTLPFSYVHTTFIAKKTPKKDTGATGNDAKKGDKTKTAKQSDDELSKELASVKKELEQSKESGTESQKQVKDLNGELEKLQQQLKAALEVKDSDNQSNTDPEAHQQELEAVVKARDEALEEIASLKADLENARKEVPAEYQTKLDAAEKAKDEALGEVDRLKEQAENAPTQAKVDELTAEIAALKQKNAKSIFARTAKSLVGTNRERKQSLALATQKANHEQALATQKESHDQVLADLQANHEQALAGQEAKLQQVERDLGQKKAALESLSAAGNGAGTSEIGIFSEPAGGSAAMLVPVQSRAASNEV